MYAQSHARNPRRWHHQTCTQFLGKSGTFWTTSYNSLKAAKPKTWTEPSVLHIFGASNVILLIDFGYTDDRLWKMCNLVRLHIRERPVVTHLERPVARE